MLCFKTTPYKIPLHLQTDSDNILAISACYFFTIVMQSHSDPLPSFQSCCARCFFLLLLIPSWLLWFSLTNVCLCVCACGWVGVLQSITPGLQQCSMEHEKSSTSVTSISTLFLPIKASRHAHTCKFLFSKASFIQCRAGNQQTLL